MRVIALFLFLFLTCPSWAQDAYPPDGAYVIPGPQGILLQWPATETQGQYIVQVYAEQTAVVEQNVTGDKLTVSLPPGPAYRWQVSQRKSQGFQEVVASREFQMVNQSSLMVAGADGESGGPRSDNNYQFNGKPGANGPDLTVTLTKAGSYTSVFVTGGVAANRLYYLAPGSGPFLIGVPGGSGGNGGTGAPGYAYEDGVDEYQGSPGGNGANGGSGGTITVISNGLPVSDYLTFDTSGGAGGTAGPGGAPGESAGVAGQPGRNGRVVIR